MLLIALAIVFGGIGIFSLSGSGSGDGAAASASTAESSGGPATTAAAAATSGVAGATVSTTPTPGAAISNPAPSGATPSGAVSSGATASAVIASDKSVPVRVLNNSDIAGLAARTAQQLTGVGWTVAETGNYVSSTIGTTTVYYGNSTQEKAAAEEIAGKLGATAQPRFGAIANLGQGVVVIVTQ
ncbi:LytR C-terminal domain-containing protein [Skermania piniformis]